MTADTARSRTLPGDTPRSVVARVVAGRAARVGAAWGLVFAVYVAVSAKGYAAAYPDAASRRHLADSLGANAGLAALLGTAHEIDTVAGFTSWRCLGVLTLVGAIWGMLTATKRLRGEEEAGRWELLLAGQTTRRDAAVQGLAGLGAGWAALLAVTAAGAELAGRSVDPSFAGTGALFFAVALSSSAAMFLALGALAGELASTRRQASTLAGTVLGAAFLVRVIADAESSLAWLRWLSPLGWVEETQPLTGARPLALLPIGALVLLVGALAVRLAAARDLGAGLLPDRDRSPARTALLRGPTALALRLSRPPALGWIGATAAGGLLVGLIARSAAEAAAGSSEAERILSRLGASQLGAGAYLGASFVILATLVAVIAAAFVSAAREEEASGRLDTLLVHPVGRTPWLLGRLGVAAVVVLAAGLAAGVFAFLGGAAQGAGVGFGPLVKAGLAIVPPGLFVLGVGALALAAVPRLTAAVAYGVTAWSFLAELVGSLIGTGGWLLDTSLLHHLSAAPLVEPDWVSAAWFVGLGAVAAALGAVILERRDLVAE